MSPVDSLAEVKALTFDVFGTVVDWRGSIIRETQELGRAKGIDIDWEAFTDSWRGLYQPQLSKVREGKMPWTKLDELHRISLEQLLGQFGVTQLSEEEIDRLNRVWHRLDPWPDSVEGLNKLHKKYALATLSNGNVALLMNMARRAGLPWDAILGAEVAKHYKPQPEAYLITADMLGLAPHEVMLVAAHNDDLVAASKLGFHTAFVVRPNEYGPGQQTDTRAEHDFDVVADSMIDLSRKLGC